MYKSIDFFECIYTNKQQRDYQRIILSILSLSILLVHPLFTIDRAAVTWDLVAFVLEIKLVIISQLKIQKKRIITA